MIFAKCRNSWYIFNKERHAIAGKIDVGHENAFSRRHVRPNAGTKRCSLRVRNANPLQNQIYRRIRRMKKRVWVMLLAIAMVLALAACGGGNGNGGGNADSGSSSSGGSGSSREGS